MKSAPRWLLLLALTAWSCIATPANLQDTIESILSEEGLTGIAWVLVTAPGDVQTGTAGLRDGPANLPFTRDTRFHVGSVTKALLATGILRLATEGRIDLNAPVLNYLPDMFDASPPEGFDGITIRHLLDHTAGIDDARLWQMFSERASADAPLAAAFPDPNQLLRPRSLPGARFSYSNLGYTLLGMVIEAVCGERYETYLDEHLLAPLSMRNSSFGFTTQQGERADSTLAWGHVDDGSRYAASPMFLRPAGQFTSTAADLGRFIEFLLGDGAFDAGTFIRKDLMDARGHPGSTEAATAGLEAGYALGIGRRDRHGVIGYCHGGNIVGFAAMLCFFPDQGKGFAYSVNTDSEIANYGRLDAQFIDALAIEPASPPPTIAPAADTMDWEGWYGLSPNRFQAFEYLDRLFGSVRLTAAGNDLELSSLQSDARQLRPTGHREYSAHDRTTTSHILLRGDRGEYLVSDGFQTFEKVHPLYLAAHWSSLLLGLAGLAWLLIAGLVSLLRDGTTFIRRPIAPAFASILLLLAPVPLFFMQSFMALGDPTPASLVLAGVTLLLPLGVLATLWLSRSPGQAGIAAWVHRVAALCLLQWCLVLAFNGMLPFRLWA